MKKEYIKPNVENLKVKMENHILVGSQTMHIGIDNNDDDSLDDDLYIG